MTYEKDPRVDAYIDPLPGLAAADLPRSATSSTRPTPRSRRRSNGTVQPYFVLKGNVAASAPRRTTSRCSCIRRRARADPDGIITGGYGNETGRMIAIHEDEPINRPAMLALFRAIIAENNAPVAGGS